VYRPGYAENDPEAAALQQRAQKAREEFIAADAAWHAHTKSSVEAQKKREADAKAARNAELDKPKSDSDVLADISRKLDAPHKSQSDAEFNSAWDRMAR